VLGGRVSLLLPKSLGGVNNTSDCHQDLDVVRLHRQPGFVEANRHWDQFSLRLVFFFARYTKLSSAGAAFGSMRV
jgi:hypothetical protein